MRSRRNNTTLTRKIDKWNTHKVWLIKRYADGHYAINQEVGGRVFYSSYQRATKAQIDAIFAHCYADNPTEAEQMTFGSAT